jgi:CubicO group peptidase (beta-lactamase class C family)
MADVKIEGKFDEKFSAARDAFAKNFADGSDVGASFAVVVNGELVVDIWGGHADAAKTRPWQRDTIANVYSTTKTMAALCALVLADRGQLDVKAPVSKYWPEFAQNGKEGVTTAHFLSHSAGLSGWKTPLTGEDIYDWGKVTRLLAEQAPLWPPGTAPGYHALTQGYLIGEVVRRITGKTIGTFFKEEIAGPIGADFWIGLPASEDARVAELIPPPSAPPGTGATTEIGRLMANPPIDPLATRTRAWRAAEIPAAGGHGNARSVAQVQSILANGGVMNGKRIMSEAGARRALEEQIEGTDVVMGVPAKFGLGYGLPGAMIPLNPNTCFWGGYGGSLVIVDFDKRACFAYVMNKMAPTTIGDLRAFSIIMEAYKPLG